MSPRKSNRPRGVIYLLVALVAATLIVLAETHVWHLVHSIRQRAESVTFDSFHISEQFEARLHQVNDKVFRYSLQQAPNARSGIAQELNELAEWLAENRALSVSAQQRDILADLETLYARYATHAAMIFQTNGVQVAPAPWRAEKEALMAQILALSANLNTAEKAALSESKTQIRNDVQLLFRRLVFSSLVLVAMGAVLAWCVFGGIIAPLRSRLRQSEAVVERQEKLSSLGVLAAGVAHEIRNPLTSIKARLFTQQSLLEKGSEALEDNVFITEEISRLEKIVAGFLAFARPAEPKMAAIKAAQLFRDLEGLFRPALAKANIHLKTEFLADPEISVDSSQIKQVLINLARNAAESIDQGGSITLRSRMEKRGRVSRSRHVAILEVEDTGKGIPPEIQQRLFDPFFTTKPNGTGLGLSIAARILEKHGGSLEFQTVLNHGTIFRLVLPVDEPKQ